MPTHAATDGSLWASASYASAPDRMVRLAAHRSGAAHEAGQRGLSDQLASYEREGLTAGGETRPRPSATAAQPWDASVIARRKTAGRAGGPGFVVVGADGFEPPTSAL